MAIRKASATWKGSLGEGDGTLTLGSGAFEGAYTYKSRRAEGPGTNPEELLAAAHAGCFSMALTVVLEMAGQTAEAIRTEAKVELRGGEAGPRITKIDLITRARVPDMDDAAFQQAAQGAKEHCVISRALAATEINLDAALEG